MFRFSRKGDERTMTEVYHGNYERSRWVRKAFLHRSSTEKGRRRPRQVVRGLACSNVPHIRKLGGIIGNKSELILRKDDILTNFCNRSKSNDLNQMI